jgi:ABC-type glycerol-3-phosphate transport system substrate-binding protein
MASYTLSRRAFLKTVGAVTLGAGLSGTLAACQPVPPSAEGESATGGVTELVTYWGDWTPTQSMERSEDNPLPHNKLLEVLDAYKADHANVQIEWIRIPEGIDPRQWTIAQQAAGTIPHIVPQGHWNLKDDLDKNWWVELTTYLEEQPNPYIPAGDPGSERWLDQFYPIPTSEARMRDGFYNIVLGLITTFFYYNVDWFNELGLTAPTTYSEFLAVGQAFKDVGVNAYGGWTGRVADTDHWYRLQMGGMVMARDIEPLVNPDRDTATLEEVACAIKTGVYHPSLPQYRNWMELWKMNVPFRPPDWTTRATDTNSKFLTKVEPIMENGTWSLPRLLHDPLMDFEWSTFFAPPVTAELSEFVTDPPTPGWPIGGPVGDYFSITTRAEKDGVFDVALDLLHWITVPENAHTIQSEIGTAMPNVKNVPVDERFQQPFELLTSQIGETQMFVYEEVKLDAEAADPIGQAWRAYLLDQMELDDAIEAITVEFDAYADRFIEREGLECA